MQPPSRPFESLDWYREASRREYRSGNAGHQALRWLKSSRCFAFHIGLFALGITIALAVNVARSPGSLWVDTLAVAWIMVLVIHAVIVSLIFAVTLLGTNEKRLPKYVPRIPSETVSGSGSRPTSPQAEAMQWPAPPPREEATPAEPVTPPPPAPTATTQPQRGWGQWSHRDREQDQVRPAGGWPTSSAAGAAETASWREASPAAWLRRKRTAAEPARTTPVPAPSGERPPETAPVESTRPESSETPIVETNPPDTPSDDVISSDATIAEATAEETDSADRENNDS